MTTKTTTCCGAERNTPFCPMCGCELELSVGYSLLAHLAHQMNIKARILARAESRGDDDEVERSTEIANQWKGWHDWLASVLKGDKEQE